MDFFVVSIMYRMFRQNYTAALHGQLRFNQVSFLYLDTSSFVLPTSSDKAVWRIVARMLGHCNKVNRLALRGNCPT